MTFFQNTKTDFTKSRAVFLVLVLVACSWAFSSCESHTFYHSYQDTPVDGWEQNDTLTFTTDSIPHDGVYAFQIGLRTTSIYPYRMLWLLVENEWRNPKFTKTDTVICHLTNAEGDLNGHGIDSYQYTYPCPSLHLRKGQVGHIRIRHIMRREILPGVSDVGIKITH